MIKLGRGLCPKKAFVKCFTYKTILKRCFLQSAGFFCNFSYILSNFSESDTDSSQLGCGIYQHAQLDGQHSHPGLLLWLLLSFPQCLGSSCVTHVPQANFGNIEPLSLHTHASHVLPDSLTVGNGKEKESCYCVTWKADEVWGERVEGETISPLGMGWV